MNYISGCELSVIAQGKLVENLMNNQIENALSTFKINDSSEK